MGTRSLIADKVSKRVIYCHWDGYPSHNGYILDAHYNNQDKVNALMDLGDLSSLGVSLDSPEDIKKVVVVEGICQNTVAFCRDKGETAESNKASPFDDFDLQRYIRRGEVNYIYVWNGSEWVVHNCSKHTD